MSDKQSPHIPPKKIVDIYVPFMTEGAEILEELEGLSGKYYLYLDSNNKVPLMICRPNVEALTAVYSEETLRYRSGHIRFSATYEFDTQWKVDAFLTTIDYLMEYRVKHILVYLNLARPGFFDSREGVIVSDLSYGKTERKTEKNAFPILCFTLDHGLLYSYKWPTLYELSLSQTLDWLELQREALAATSRNRIQRALNAFSYLFHDNLHDNTASDLFFAIAGLEALFVEGDLAIQKQVDIKTQLILGSRTEFKRLFNDLYNFRSKFIHGQLDIPNRFHFEDDDEKVIDHNSDSYQYSTLAIMILIASIQQHLIQGKDEMEFELVLKG
jgi:hypothetical protein